MIKCNVNVCGIICRAAEIRTGKDGSRFVAFGVAVDIPATKGDPTPVFISVSAANADASVLTQGRRIALKGTLRIKGAPDHKQYFNLAADSIELDPVAEAGISGTMEFRGSLCKDIKTPIDKKGQMYQRFSAFSTDRSTKSLGSDKNVGEEFCVVFVRFVHFESPIADFMVPKAKIEVKGAMRLSSFNGKIDISCKVDEIKPWVKDFPFPKTTDENPPF